jgi:hypothetical protein
LPTFLPVSLRFLFDAIFHTLFHNLFHNGLRRAFKTPLCVATSAITKKSSEPCPQTVHLYSR